MSTQQRQSPPAPHGLHSLLPPPFSCVSRLEGARTVRVEVTGELDVFTTPELERALRQVAVSAQHVVLDLHSLKFIDSSGVHAIEDASLRALLRGAKLVVTRAPAHAARILALAGTSSTIELLDQAA